MSTSDQIAALKANAEALKAPLRARYWELEAIRAPIEAQIAALQAERDANHDNLTITQLAAYADQIRVLQEQIEPTRQERSDILKALKDDDGKIRLGNP